MISNLELLQIMETVKDRLLQYLQYLEIGQNKFEAQVGLSRGYINKLRHAPKPDKLAQILAAFPELNRTWLLSGEGDMLNTADADPAPNTVPLIPAHAIGGRPVGFDIDGITAADCQRVLSPEPAADIAIDIAGHSMTPDYPAGCRVYARREDGTRPIRYGETYILDTPDGILLKRIYPHAADPALLRLVSINPEYPPYDYPRADIRALYRVLSRLIRQ